MNPEAEKLRDAIRRCGDRDALHCRQWLRDHCYKIAELVDAAIDVSRYHVPVEPDGPPLFRGDAGVALRRLARAVADFKGPQHPDPKIERMEVLRCPSPECGWWNAREDDGPASYHDHRRLVHGEVGQ